MSDTLTLSDPEMLRNALGAQQLASRVLPCVDTRSVHWRYYLLQSPADGPGRPIAIGSKLLQILEQTPSRGLGRRLFRDLERRGRRPGPQFRQRLEASFREQYSTSCQNFWSDAKGGGGPSAPSSALVRRARDYVVAGDFGDFFDVGRPSKLRQLFRERLIAFRPGLARLIVSQGYDLLAVAAAAPRSRLLQDEDRWLLLAWALLQSYYGVADTGGDEQDDLDEDGPPELIETDERELANATLALLKAVGNHGGLTQRQVVTIETALRRAARRPGRYHPPVSVPALKSDGTRRRLFASLRLSAFRRLLMQAHGHGR